MADCGARVLAVLAASTQSVSGSELFMHALNAVMELKCCACSHVHPGTRQTLAGRRWVEHNLRLRRRPQVLGKNCPRTPNHPNSCIVLTINRIMSYECAPVVGLGDHASTLECHAAHWLHALVHAGTDFHTTEHQRSGGTALRARIALHHPYRLINPQVPSAEASPMGLQ